MGVGLLAFAVQYLVHDPHEQELEKLTSQGRHQTSRVHFVLYSM